MGEEKKGFLVMGHQNPLKHIETKYNECETLFNTWLAKQSLPVEAAIVTVTSALKGAAIGGLTSLPNDVSSSFSPPPPSTSLTLQTNASFQQSQAVAGWPLAQARNLAVTCGVNAGISCVLRRLRGKEDVQSNMAAGFGSGVMFSLVSGIGGSNQAATAITSGVLFALAQGGFFKIREKISMPNPEDVLYNETRGSFSFLSPSLFSHTQQPPTNGSSPISVAGTEDDATMMHMTFYWGTSVTLLFDSWKTDSLFSYSLTLIACLLFSVFYQYMEDRRLRFKLLSSSAVSNNTDGAVDATPLLKTKIFARGGRWSVGRFTGSVLFGINSALGYFLMLAIMSFNGGVFVAIVVGLAIGYLLFRSGDDEQVVVVDNPCACA